MAQFETSAGIEKLTGKLAKKSSTTTRQKTWHYPDGRIFGYGPKEVFCPDKRDYTRHPRKGEEAKQHQRWTAACREASRITKDASHPRYKEMCARHEAQLYGKPDPLLGKKRICQFGNFVRTILVREQKEHSVNNP